MTVRRLLDLLRIAFVPAAAIGAFLALRGRWDDVAGAVARTPMPSMLVAFAFVMTGVTATSVVWLRVVAGYGHRVPWSAGSRVFFVGQLGKYIPGSLWSIGAQARMASEYGVPARSTVGASLVFLGVHVATALMLGAGLILAGPAHPPVPAAGLVLVLVLGAVGLAPAVVNRLGTLVAGRSSPLRLRGGDLAGILLLMTAAWACYAAALATLLPLRSPGTLAAATGAFAVAYAVGVLIVLAPAGLGAREAAFVLLLAPVTGVAVATSLALLTRALQTAADFLLAALAWRTGHRVAPPQPSSREDLDAVRRRRRP